MSWPDSVAIIGLGLMGGSLARDLSSHPIRIVGFDARPDILEAARSEGIVHASLPPDLTGIEDVDLVVLATPVDVALEMLSLLAPRLSARSIVTDVGSTKAAVAERAEALGLGERFAGSHPLAGDHRSGWTAARVGLYEGVPVYVCPTESAAPIVAERVMAFWSTIGARPVIDDAAAHDRRMAAVSHLPQVIASALAAVLDEEGISPAALGPGGRDMTRLAASSPEMWVAICLANSANLLDALERLQRHLGEARDAAARRDPDELLRFFQRGRSWLA